MMKGHSTADETQKHMSTLDITTTNPSQQIGTTEEITMSDPALQHLSLHREFKPRQVSMIAIAGAIGTGLIIGSGTGLARGGPASLLIAYSIIGLVVFFVMSALAEMATFLPMDKGFSGYAARMVDPAFGCVIFPSLTPTRCSFWLFHSGGGQISLLFGSQLEANYILGLP